MYIFFFLCSVPRIWMELVEENKHLARKIHPKTNWREIPSIERLPLLFPSLAFNLQKQAGLEIRWPKCTSLFSSWTQLKAMTRSSKRAASPLPLGGGSSPWSEASLESGSSSLGPKSFESHGFSKRNWDHGPTIPIPTTILPLKKSKSQFQVSQSSQGQLRQVLWTTRTTRSCHPADEPSTAPSHPLRPARAKCQGFLEDYLTPIPQGHWEFTFFYTTRKSEIKFSSWMVQIYRFCTWWCHKYTLTGVEDLKNLPWSVHSNDVRYMHTSLHQFVLRISPKAFLFPDCTLLQPLNWRSQCIQSTWAYSDCDVTTLHKFTPFGSSIPILKKESNICQNLTGPSHIRLSLHLGSAQSPQQGPSWAGPWLHLHTWHSVLSTLG